MVGGTHPALVEAMGAGRVVFFLDNPPNREVVGGVGVPFRFDGEPSLDYRQHGANVLGANRGGAAARQRLRLVREHCDALVAIPMAGQCSSLNVSVAAGVLLYETVRQRGRTGGPPAP